MNGQVDGRDLVKQYVRELERALRDLGEEHPDEAVDEIRAHLEEGIGEANDPNVAIRLMLDLGRPEDVAASLVAGRTDGVVPAPRPLTTAARVLDAIIAFTPLVVLLLAPVHALIDLLETRALIGSAAVGLGGVEALILGVPALLGTVWAFTYLAQARRPGGSISRGALGLDTIRQGGRSFVVQTPTPAGRASRQRRGRLVRLLLTVTMFVVSVTAMTGWVLSYDPSDAAARIGGWTQGEVRLTEAETRSRAVIDDYYDALRRRLVDAALSYYGDAQGESFEALYPVELLDGSPTKRSCSGRCARRRAWMRTPNRSWCRIRCKSPSTSVIPRILTAGESSPTCLSTGPTGPTTPRRSPRCDGCA